MRGSFKIQNYTSKQLWKSSHPSTVQLIRVHYECTTYLYTTLSRFLGGRCDPDITSCCSLAIMFRLFYIVETSQNSVQLLLIMSAVSCTDSHLLWPVEQIHSYYSHLRCIHDILFCPSSTFGGSTFGALILVVLPTRRLSSSSSSGSLPIRPPDSSASV